MPTAKPANMKVNRIGMSWKIRCCIGSGAGGLIEVVSQVVIP